MHYLVTGGCGFIGLHLVRQLLSEGHNVTIIDDLSNSTKDNVPPQATLIVQDITVAGVLDALVQKVDGVFHLAAVVSVVKSTEAWKRTHEVTLGGMVALLDALARFKRHIPVVYCSSAAVYGDKSDVPFREDCHCTPISAYGADKLSCELHARVGYLVHGIPSIGLRFFNVYGEGQDPHSPYAGVISIFAGQMRASQPVTIYGDGEQIRDYIHVSDVVTAMGASMKALERKSLTPCSIVIFGASGVRARALPMPLHGREIYVLHLGILRLLPNSLDLQQKLLYTQGWNCCSKASKYLSHSVSLHLFILNHMNNFDLFVLIPFCIVAETLSVLCFKCGVNKDESNEQDKGFITMIFTTPLLWLGIALWAAELVSWIVVLEHAPLSVAFPLMSVIYCTVPLAGKWFLGEKLPSRQWLATALIAVGVALVGSTGV